MTALVEQKQPTRRSVFTALLWTLSAAPSIALGLLLSMAVRVRLADGAWPVRNQPDPKELGFHNTITLVVILISFVAVLAVPLLALGGALLRRRYPPLGPLVLGLTGFIALVVVLRGDVAGLGDWIGD